MMNPVSEDEPIAALATPWGQSAVGVIRISGKGCLERLSVLFSPVGAAGRDPAGSRGHTLLHGFIVDGGERIDEVLLAVYRGPRSYTGEDGAEISCHGGPVIIRRILELLLRSGFRQAGPGEFTLRAFLNGKMDLTRAEAVNEIIRSKTDRARSLALNRLSGGLERRMLRIRDALIRLSAAVEVRIDYPDEDETEIAPSAESRPAGSHPGSSLDQGGIAALEQEIEQDIERLLSTYRTGRIFQDGARVAIAGRTNSGKSTLFNLLLREDRAIVSESHGTTRDYIEAGIEVGGIPIRLFDTAGLRSSGESGDLIEQEGMRRTRGIIGGADLVLYLVDSTRGLDHGDRGRLAQEGNRGPGEPPELLPVWTKSDLPGGSPPEGFVRLSAETGSGLEELNSEIRRRIIGSASADGGEVVIDSFRQKELLEACLAALRSFRDGLGRALPLDVVAVDLREAMDRLGEITGEVASHEVLNQMFSAFCVGK